MEAKDELKIERLMWHINQKLECISCTAGVNADTYNMQLFARMAFDEGWRVINKEVKCPECVK